MADDIHLAPPGNQGFGIFSAAAANVGAYGTQVQGLTADTEKLTSALLTQMKAYEDADKQRSDAMHKAEEDYRAQMEALDRVNSKMRETVTEGISTLETLNEVGAAGSAVVQKLYTLKTETVETQKVSTEALDAIEKLIEEKMPRARIWLSKLVQDAADGKLSLQELLNKMTEFVGNSAFQQLDVVSGHFYGDLQGFIIMLDKLKTSLLEADKAAAGAAQR